MLIPSTLSRSIPLWTSLFLLWAVGDFTLYCVFYPDDAVYQVASAAFLVLLIVSLYRSAPIICAWLAPARVSTGITLTRVADSIRAIVDAGLDPVPVHIVDDRRAFAITVGISTSSSRVFISSALVDGLSDDALRFALAHEFAHANGRHIVATMIPFLILAAAWPFLHSASMEVYAPWVPIVWTFLRWHFEFVADRRAYGVLNYGADQLQEIGQLTASCMSWLNISHPPLAWRCRAISVIK